MSLRIYLGVLSLKLIFVRLSWKLRCQNFACSSLPHSCSAIVQVLLFLAVATFWSVIVEPLKIFSCYLLFFQRLLLIKFSFFRRFHFQLVTLLPGIDSFGEADWFIAWSQAWFLYSFSEKMARLIDRHFLQDLKSLSDTEFLCLQVLPK